jgi:ComF family protein
MLYERLQSIQEWLMPGTCVLCDARIPSTQTFCASCDAALPRLVQPCPQCAAPIEGAITNTLRCGACQKRPPAFARAFALYGYAPPIDGLIRGLKYHRRLELARILGEQLAQGLASAARGVDLVVPVPLHRARLHERGYNQSLELARPVAKHLKLSLDFTCLQRTRATVPQAGLTPVERRQNVRGAFVATPAVNKLRVAIVDDVMTTGHTANAVAQCLRKAGAKEVQVWVVARA